MTSAQRGEGELKNTPNLRTNGTVLVLRMAHRKWKEVKQLPSMLPGSAVPDCC